MAKGSAFGTTLSVTIASVLTPVAELTNIGGLSLDSDEIDVTTHDSTEGWREFVQGLKDGGSFDVEGIYMADASQKGLVTLLGAGTVGACEIVFPSTLGKWTFNGFVKSFATDGPMDDALKFTATIRVSGKPTLA